jgi:hypothetical protein
MTDAGDPRFVILHQYDVDPAGDSRRDLWDEFVPKLKAIPGFVGVYTFDDPDAGEGVSLTFWESESAANEYLTSGARERLDTLAADFRPETNRRVMKILQSDDTRY